jgi:hypothetical protein
MAVTAAADMIHWFAQGIDTILLYWQLAKMY